MSGYIPNVPTANQTIAQTQSPINDNFTIINTAFGVDHVPMVNMTNQGNHNQVTLVSGSAPGGAVAQGPIVYCSPVTYGASTRSEIFQIQDIADGGQTIQLSQTLYTNPSASNGYSYLPGGILLQWGTNAAVANGGTVSFPKTFPTACVNVQVTLNIATALNSIGINGFSTTGFTFRTNAGGSVPITFFAIGY